MQTPDSTAQPPGLARPSVSFDASDDMAAVGNQLVYFCRDAVFVGPTPWKRIAEGEILGIRPTDDGKGVEIVRRLKPVRPEDEVRYERAVCDGASEKLDFQPVKFGTPDSPLLGDPWNYVMGDSLLAYHRSAGTDWVRLPTSGPKTWAVGPSSPGLTGGNEHHTVLATRQAYWIFGQGKQFGWIAIVDATAK